MPGPSPDNMPDYAGPGPEVPHITMPKVPEPGSVTGTFDPYEIAREYNEDLRRRGIEPEPAPPFCLSFLVEDFAALDCIHADSRMLPQPDEIIDAMQRAVDNCPDEFSAGELTRTLMKLEECALLSEQEIAQHGFTYYALLHACSKRTDVPDDYEEWAELNRTLQRQYKEEHHD